MKKATIQQVRQLDSQTDRLANKQASGLIQSAVTWNERNFTNIDQTKFAISGGTNRPAPNQTPVVTFQKPQHTRGEKYGQVPYPTVEDIMNGRSTQQRSYLSYDFENPKRQQNNSGYQVAGTTQDTIAPEPFPGYDDDGFQIGQYAKGINVNNKLFSASGTPQSFYDIYDSPLALDRGRASDDAVENLRFQQNKRGNTYYQGVIARKEKQVKADASFMASKLSI